MLIYNLKPYKIRTLSGITQKEHQPVKLPMSRIKYLVNIIKEIENVDIVSPEFFLEYMKKNNIDIFKDLNLLSYEHFEKKIITNSLEEINKEIEEITKTFDGFNYGKLGGDTYYHYNDKRKKYVSEIKGTRIIFDNYNMRKISDKIVNNLISKTLKKRKGLFDIDIFALPDELSIYLNNNLPNYEIPIGKPKQQSYNKKLYTYNKPSIPIDINFIKTGIYTEELLEKFKQEVIEYWESYNIVKKLPKKIENLIDQSMTIEEIAETFKENKDIVEEYYDEIEFYSVEELKKVQYEKAEELLKMYKNIIENNQINVQSSNIKTQKR